MLGGPEGATDGVHRHALRVTVAVGEQAGHGFVNADEGIVCGQATVEIQPVDFSVGPGKILSLIRETSISDGEKNVALAIEHNAGSVMMSGSKVAVGRRFKNDLLIGPLIAFETTPNDACHGIGFVGSIHRLRMTVGQVNPAILSVMRPLGHIQEPSLPLGKDSRDALHRLRGKGAILPESEMSPSLGDQCLAGVQKIDPPGHVRKRASKNPRCRI